MNLLSKNSLVTMALLFTEKGKIEERGRGRGELPDSDLCKALYNSGFCGNSLA